MTDRKPVEKPKLGGTAIVKMWKEDTAALRRILLLYGDHSRSCITNPLRPVWHPEEDCDCGWREIYTDMGLYERDLRSLVDYNSDYEEGSGTE